MQAYITGNAFVILTGPDTILQTIYDEDENELEAITIDEGSGKLATCTGSDVRVYKPYGEGEDALKVCCCGTSLVGTLMRVSGLYSTVSP